MRVHLDSAVLEQEGVIPEDGQRAMLEPLSVNRPGDSVVLVLESGTADIRVILDTSELQRAIGFCKDDAKATSRLSND
jgi:hypothetical protein